MKDTRPQKIIFITILVLLIIGGCFYWFQLRPSQIRKDCSWVSGHEDARPEILSPTTEQITKYNECRNTQDKPLSNLDKLYMEEVICQKPRDPRPAQPARDYWVEASPEEYNFCLHNKGLK